MGAPAGGDAAQVLLGSLELMDAGMRDVAPGVDATNGDGGGDVVRRRPRDAMGQSLLRFAP
jgi:hypothetical protein